MARGTAQSHGSAAPDLGMVWSRLQPRLGFGALAVPALAAVMLLAAAGCGRRLDVAEPGALFLNLARAERIEVYGAGEALGARAEAFARRLSLSGAHAVRLLPEGARGDSDAPRVIVGTFESELGRELLAHVGLRFEEDGFELGERRYATVGGAVAATFADPDRACLPVTVVLASDAEALDDLLARFRPAWKPHVQAWQWGTLVFAAPLTSRGVPVGAGARAEPDWVALSREYRKVEAEGLAAFASQDVPESRVLDYLASSARARDRVALWAPAAADSRLSLFLVARIDALDGPHDALAHGDPVRGTVTALLADGMPDDAGQALARIVCRRTLGPPAEEWLLDGAAVDAADAWWGVPLGEWCAWLMLGESTPQLAELLDPSAAERISPHVLLPMRGLLFRSLREGPGRDAAWLARLWRGEERLEADLELERAFKDYARNVLDAHGADALTRREGRSADSRPLRGATLAHRLGDHGRSFGSRYCAESLDMLAGLGANAVSIRSFLALGPAAEGGPAIARRRMLRTMEGDVAIAMTAALARDRGLAVMLRANVLASPSGPLLASTVLTDADAWRGFFAEFERAIEHYALLAELAGCEILCLGAGLAEATWIRPGAADEEPLDEAETALRRAKSDGWARIIRRARQAFGGALTYGALGAHEVLRTDFWERLDFVGIDLYPRLEDNTRGGPLADRRAVASIAGALAQARERARELGLDLAVTEVGFRSTARAWKGAIDGGGALDLARQAGLYRQFARALELVAGAGGELPAVFLGPWDTDPDAGGSLDRGWSPRNKPAQAVFAEMMGGR